jgi:hypothetical protein
MAPQAEIAPETVRIRSKNGISVGLAQRTMRGKPPGTGAVVDLAQVPKRGLRAGFD